MNCICHLPLQVIVVFSSMNVLHVCPTALLSSTCYDRADSLSILQQELRACCTLHIVFVGVIHDYFGHHHW
jgi:hypothetical protein